MNLKQATNSDIEYIVKVCLDADKIYNEIMPDAFKNQSIKYENSGLPDKYNMWIIEKDDNNIGFFAEKKIDERTTYIVGLYIHSKYQRLGYGNEIINYIKDMKTSERLLLLVHQKAIWAINFYKKIGFDIVGVSKEAILAYESKMKSYYIPHTFLMEMIIK